MAQLVVRLWLLAGSLVLCACRTPPAPNIVLIVIDTLRADRVDLYDPAKQLTPFVTSLAQDGSVFWNAYAASSWTSPSMASLWTSRYQSQHGVSVFASVLADSEVTLAEILRQHGYRTAGFVANPNLALKAGFAQGFDHYYVSQPKGMLAKERAPELDRQCLEWLDRLGTSEAPAKPVLLYLQYMEPHAPTLFPPAEALDAVLARRHDAADLRKAYGDLLFPNAERTQQPESVPRALWHVLYEAEVRGLDQELQRFFAALEQRGMLRNAVVVVTADHGEELYDHGGHGHGQTLYNEVARVPLLIRAPGEQGRQVVHRPVSLIDIAPTVLDLAGIPSPATFEGRSLRSTLGTPPVWRRLADRLGLLVGWQSTDSAAVYMELRSTAEGKPPRHVRAVVEARYKLMVTPDGSHEFSDLQADPREVAPALLPDTVRKRLDTELRTYEQRAAHRPAEQRTQSIDAETRERLRALGYGN